MDRKLEKLQNEEKIIFQIKEVIRTEYNHLKKDCKNYGEIQKKCTKRSKEISYRHAEIGQCVQKVFKECLEKDIQETRFQTEK